MGDYGMILNRNEREELSMTARRFFTHPLGILLAAIVATFLWGSAFPFIKLSYEHLQIESHEIGEQLVFAGYRFFLSACMIFLFFRLLGKKMVCRRETLPTLVTIATFQTFLQYILFYIGLSYSTGIQGSIIAGTTSFFQILLAHFMYKDDSFSLRKGIGILIGFSGVVVVNMTKGVLNIDIGIGEVLLLVSMFVSAYDNILAKNASMKMEIGYLTAYQMLFGSIGLLMIGSLSSSLFPFTFTGTTIAMLLYLSFLSAAGFVLWNNVMKYNKVGNVSMYLFLIPVFGVFLSSMILHEPLHMLVLIGLALVTVGIIVVNRARPSTQKDN
jgi:drug/metabolite transporter (DMT)-like permease